MVEKLEKAHIIFHSQYIKDLSFENPGTPPGGGGQPKSPKVHVNCSVGSKPIKGKDKHYEITLMLSATAKEGDEVLFIAEVAYGGEMSVSADVPAKNVQPLVMIEGPRHLFPFVRMLMNSIVREGGFLPLNIQPIDFAHLYQQRMQHMGGEAKDGAAGGVGNGAAKKNGKG